MPPHQQANTPQSSVTSDRLFAPAPHPLIADQGVSYAAFRLWCVLHRLAWLREPPEIERLCIEMRQNDREPDRRSIYRWLKELNDRGWLDWERSPGRTNSNRFVVRSERRTDAPPTTLVSQVASERDTPVILRSQPVTPESQPVILRSQPVTPESQPVIVGSQAPQVYPLPERMDSGPKNHENHENTKNHENHHHRDDDGADDDDDVVRFLRSLNVERAAEFAGLDFQAVQDRVTRIQRDPNWLPGAIVKSLRLFPPKPAALPAPPADWHGDLVAAEARARAFLPPDVSAEELAIAAADLAEGRTEEEVTIWLGEHRARAAYWQKQPRKERYA